MEQLWFLIVKKLRETVVPDCLFTTATDNMKKCSNCAASTRASEQLWFQVLAHLPFWPPSQHLQLSSSGAKLSQICPFYFSKTRDTASILPPHNHLPHKCVASAETLL